MRYKKDDIRYRKDVVLSIVVNEYIRNTTPVSSAHIVQDYFPDLSSATVRNVLAELEEEGLLTHPHTSAGRIPTQDGYRYYVDHLMREIQLLENEKERIHNEYEAIRHDLETVLEKTSEVIANVTHYTSIISVDGSPNKFFCKGTRYIVEYPLTQEIEKIRYILTMLEEKERILALINRELEAKIKIYIGQEIVCSDTDNCSLAVSQYKLKNGLSGRMAVLGPTRMDYERVVSALDYFSKLLEEIL